MFDLSIPTLGGVSLVQFGSLVFGKKPVALHIWVYLFAHRLESNNFCFGGCLYQIGKHQVLFEAILVQCATSGALLKEANNGEGRTSTTKGPFSMRPGLEFGI